MGPSPTVSNMVLFCNPCDASPPDTLEAPGLHELVGRGSLPGIARRCRQREAWAPTPGGPDHLVSGGATGKGSSNASRSNYMVTRCAPWWRGLQAHDGRLGQGPENCLAAFKGPQVVGGGLTARLLANTRVLSGPFFGSVSNKCICIVVRFVCILVTNLGAAGTSPSGGASLVGQSSWSPLCISCCVGASYTESPPHLGRQQGPAMRQTRQRNHTGF